MNQQQQKLLQEWRESAWLHHSAYRIAAARMESYARWFGGVSAIISGLTSITLLGSSVTVAEALATSTNFYVQVVCGLVTIISGGLSGVQSFNFSKWAKDYANMAFEYGLIRREIEVKLASGLSEEEAKKAIPLIQQKYKVTHQAVSLPDKYIKKAEQQRSKALADEKS